MLKIEVENGIKKVVNDRISRDKFFKNTFYPKYRREGYQVYWIHTPQHNSTSEGYIGVSPLCMKGLMARYNIELWYYQTYGDEGIGRAYLMDSMLENYDDLQYSMLRSDQSVDDAKAYERYLRPSNNHSYNRDSNNWNSRKGGS